MPSIGPPACLFARTVDLNAWQPANHVRHVLGFVLSQLGLGMKRPPLPERARIGERAKSR
jgi:hypothetical protein